MCLMSDVISLKNFGKLHKILHNTSLTHSQIPDGPPKPSILLQTSGPKKLT